MRANVLMSALHPTFLRAVYIFKWEELIKELWLLCWNEVSQSSIIDFFFNQPDRSCEVVEMEKPHTLLPLEVQMIPSSSFIDLTVIYFAEVIGLFKVTVNWGGWNTCSVTQCDLNPFLLKEEKILISSFFIIWTALQFYSMLIFFVIRNSVKLYITWSIFHGHCYLHVSTKRGDISH